MTNPGPISWPDPTWSTPAGWQWPKNRGLIGEKRWPRFDPLWWEAKSLPSLDLNFAISKSLVDQVTGQSLVSFARASTGSYVGSDGLVKTAAANVPRFDHNPTTGESLGLLVEEARTNLLVRSEEFDNASWAKTALLAFGSGSTTNAIAAPSGAGTADLLTEDTATAEHFTEQNFSTTSGATYSFSVFVKAGASKTTVVLRLTSAAWSGGANNQVRFNLSTGASTILSGSPVAFSQNFGNGWWRFTIVSTASSAGTPAARIHLTDSSGNTNYAGDGTSGIYIWGAQLEAGAFPTSYIPTTSATATRAADVASITGANFSSWYNQTEGVMFASGDFANAGAGSFSRIVSLAGANAGIDEISFYTRVAIGAGDGAIYGTVTVNSSLEADLNPPPGLPNSSGGYRSAIAYKANDFGLSSNGFTPAIDTSGSLPTITQLIIMGNIRFQNRLSGHVRRLTFWPIRLPNATLQTITQ